MSGTIAGARKAAKKNLAKNPNYYKEIGGGRVKHPRKGFGHDNRTLWQKLRRVPSRARVAGQLGGTISRRTP